ncbi:hemerythrin domain-containing protein [Flavobacterium antarcticum]|uniref:hemerythrin domain-containing protein n=1 Tax=Flavobacterium antarcticum TaxID=271155 RepID=UPI0003B68979|nr:hemerythrin domain-containing protein [Flavobacterium antarcticum]
MPTKKPIKRNENLKAISREHHHGLLLSWKIRAGVKKEVEPIRIKKYLDWFYTEHLLPHFEIEEKHIFPILGNEHELVKKALTEHRRLMRLFESDTDLVKNIHLIEEELESHIRFEERVLFNEIQEVASEEQLEQVRIHHTEEKFVDNDEDAFWL